MTGQPDACAIGNEGCPCTTGGACNSGLSCKSNVCVNLGGDGGLVDSGSDASDLDASDAGCVGSTSTYPAAKACPDFNWACWPVAPDSPGSGNYTVLTICGDQVVVDKTTKLMWAQAEESGTYTFTAAKNQCTGSRRAGFSDWRLPTRIELTSLIDYGTSSAPTIDPVFSSGGNQVWTSSADALSSGNAWYVFFGNSATTVGPTSSTYTARCVR